MKGEGIAWILALGLGFLSIGFVAASMDLGAAHGGALGVLLGALLVPVTLLLVVLGWWIRRQRLRREQKERSV